MLLRRLCHGNSCAVVDFGSDTVNGQGVLVAAVVDLENKAAVSCDSAGKGALCRIEREAFSGDCIGSDIGCRIGLACALIGAVGSCRIVAGGVHIINIHGVLCIRVVCELSFECSVSVKRCGYIAPTDEVHADRCGRSFDGAKINGIALVAGENRVSLAIHGEGECDGDNGVSNKALPVVDKVVHSFSDLRAHGRRGVERGRNLLSISK